MKLEHSLNTVHTHTHTHTQTTTDQTPKCKAGHYKTQRKNIGRTLDDINQSKILYDPPLREMEIKKEKK